MGGGCGEVRRAVASCPSVRSHTPRRRASRLELPWSAAAVGRTGRRPDSGDATAARRSSLSLSLQSSATQHLNIPRHITSQVTVSSSSLSLGLSPTPPVLPYCSISPSRLAPVSSPSPPCSSSSHSPAPTLSSYPPPPNISCSSCSFSSSCSHSSCSSSSSCSSYCCSSIVTDDVRGAQHP